MAMRILAVDDERQVLDFFKTMLQPLGLDVLAMSDSKEAARLVEMEKFDGIALDAVMPQLDGFQLTERIRNSRLNSRVPVILFTGHSAIDMMRRGFQAGITFFLPKPLSPEKLRGLFNAARGAMLQEMRRSIRLPVRIIVDCICAGERCEARSVDIGQDGILLERITVAGLGGILEMRFTLPGTNQLLGLLGKVIREEGPGNVAVEFIEPDPQEREALEHFIEAKTSF